LTRQAIGEAPPQQLLLRLWLPQMQEKYPAALFEVFPAQKSLLQGALQKARG
jgi:hypothetical protein